MSGGEDPSLVDEHAAAPMADFAQGRQGNVHGDLKNVALNQSSNLFLAPRRASSPFRPSLC